MDEMLRQKPEQVLVWLEKAITGQISSSDKINWLGLAQGAALQATKETDEISDDDKLKWACVAIKIYNYLSDSLDIEGRDSYENSGMNLRAVMIRKFGVVSKHPVLDLDSIEKWFFTRLPISLARAKKIAPDWHQQPLDTIKQLRKIKNRLSIIELLVKEGYWQDNISLVEWIQLKNKLP